MATKIGRRIATLGEGNPWWRNPNWHESDPDLRDAKGNQIDYHSGTLDELQEGNLYILRGPRRVGKTVAIKQTIKALLDSGKPVNSIVRISAEGWTTHKLEDFLTSTPLPPIPEGSSRYWFIDEISSINGRWDQLIKELRDENPEFRAATVVLTGSNAASLAEAAGTLAGRRGKGVGQDRILLPMGFATFVSLVKSHSLPPRADINLSEVRGSKAKAAYDSLNPWLGELVKLWELYLGYGGFPQVVAAAKAGIPIPENFVNTLFDVIQNDAFKASKLDITTSTALQEAVWRRISVPLVVANVANEVGILDDVLTRHLQYLRDSFLLWRCPKRQPLAWLALEKSQDKIYAIDPIVSRLAHLRNPKRADVDITVLSEMQIGMALKRRLAATGVGVGLDDTIFYFTNASRTEIDFISDYLGAAALEGKYTENDAWKPEAATLKASQWDGIMLTRNVLDTSDSETWAVPAAIFCYLLDT